MRREDCWIIYPEYFDYKLSRRLGRKIPLRYAILSPKLDEVAEAVRKLKIPILRVEPDKHHPAYWIERRGRIIISKVNGISKRRLLIRIARELSVVRKKREMLKKMKKEKKKSKDIEKYLERVLKKKK